MKIYAQEIKDGLEQSITENSTLAYASPAACTAEPNLEDVAVATELLKTEAENKEQIDLYYLSAILVSTGWNKNDDVFDPAEVWTARNTPEDKQFNFMHNEADIIGHITGNYAVDFAGNKISDELQESPEEFNIVTSAVLYTSWSDPDLRERMNKIIAEIEDGDKWFVSMECLFSNFDYALTNMASGETKIVNRNEASAFLTRHLRAYGGSGSYGDYKVGRLLRDISFSGKGLVSKPANPRSVILKESNMAFSEASAQTIEDINLIKESKDMNLENKIEELEAALATANATIETLQTQLEETAAQEEQAQAEALETAMTEKDETIAGLSSQIEEATAKVAELEATLAEITEAKETAEAALAQIELEKITAARLASLVEAGLTEEAAEEAVAKFESLDEETFAGMVSLLDTVSVKEETEAEVAPVALETEEEAAEEVAEIEVEEVAEEAPAEEPAEEEEIIEEPAAELEEEADDAEAEASEEVLEEAEEVADVTLAEAGELVDPAEELRTQASTWIAEHVLTTTKNITE